MKTETHKTKVKFLKEGTGTLAVFIDEPAEFNGYRRDNVMCYSHVGQHSPCAPEYYKKLQRATPAEYADLKRELEELGYNLEIL